MPWPRDRDLPRDIAAGMKQVQPAVRRRGPTIPVSHRCGFRHWRWHLDEMYVKLDGEKIYLWPAVSYAAAQLLRQMNEGQKSGSRKQAANGRFWVFRSIDGAPRPPEYRSNRMRGAKMDVGPPPLSRMDAHSNRESTLHMSPSSRSRYHLSSSTRSRVSFSTSEL
jgi:hypothetical protein